GQRDTLATDIRRDLNEVEALTQNNTNLTVNVALSYGARQELVEAVRTIANKAKAGELAPATIDENLIEQYLSTAGIPDPDLLIRTGGDERLSNFLLWQSAYTELYFTETLWPDFSPEQLDLAITAYQKRERRFGGREEA